MSAPQCCAWIRNAAGNIVQCTRRATHRVGVHEDKGTCTQHARPNDVPVEAWRR